MSPAHDIPAGRFLLGALAAWVLPSAAIITAAEKYDVISIEQPDPGYLEPAPVDTSD